MGPAAWCGTAGAQGAAAARRGEARRARPLPGGCWLERRRLGGRWCGWSLLVLAWVLLVGLRGAVLVVLAAVVVEAVLRGVVLVVLGVGVWVVLAAVVVEAVLRGVVLAVLGVGVWVVLAAVVAEAWRPGGVSESSAGVAAGLWEHGAGTTGARSGGTGVPSNRGELQRRGRRNQCTARLWCLVFGARARRRCGMHGRWPWKRGGAKGGGRQHSAAGWGGVRGPRRQRGDGK